MKVKLAPLEKEIQKAICDYLTIRRVFHWRVNTGAMSGEHKGKKWFMRFGFPGVADIIGILPPTAGRVPGRFLAIEVKRGIQRQSPAQVEFQKSVEGNGGRYILAYSVDDVIKALSQ